MTALAGTAEHEGVLLGPARLAAVIVAVAVLVAGGVVWGASRAEPDPTRAAAVDVGFMRDMQVHHAQAVQMSTIVRERSGDATVDQLALDVLLTQQQQVGQMYGWLAARGIPQTAPGPPMQWMDDAGGTGAGHGGHGSAGSPATAMPGMATEAQLAALRSATGRDAALRYVRLMIPHHLGGIAMAQVASSAATDPYVRRLADRMGQSQMSEVRQLRALEKELLSRGTAKQTR